MDGDVFRTPMNELVNIAVGAGFAGDHHDLGKRAAEALLTVDGPRYLIFECLAERTLALVAGASDKTIEQNAAIDFLMPCIEICTQNQIRILSNFGGTDPRGVATAIARYLHDKGLNLKVAVVTGDQIPLSYEDQKRGTICCNAYTGAKGLVDALALGADIIVAGRVADPALVVAPVVHELSLGWSDWNALASATLAGHLIECGTQVCGGYFADLDKPVPGLAALGAPIAQVRKSSVQIRKPLGGGVVSPATVKEQLLYEIGDPSAYLTPDVTLDLSHVEIEEMAPDHVSISGMTGHPKPATLKTLTCFQSGYIGEAEISYMGTTSGKRAELARDVLLSRLADLQDCIQIDLFEGTEGATPVARIRLAIRHEKRGVVERALRDVEALYVNGPAGGGGVRKMITPMIVTKDGTVAQEDMTHKAELVAAS